MFTYRIRVLMVLAIMLILPIRSVVSAETWRLEQGEDWKAVSGEGEDRYLLAVAKIKQLVDAGQCEAVGQAVEGLKKEFPDIAGPELDGFIEAEILYCEGKFTKAARSYDKFLAEFPESGLYEAALERQFSIATAFLAGQKRPVLKVFKMRGYDQGARIMENIGDRAGDAPIGVKAAVQLAKSYEKRSKFNEAYEQWSLISSQWSTGQIGAEALLGMARCKHAAYGGPRYDSSALISAKSYYENYKLRYPERAKELNIDERLEQIEEQLAYKQFDIGRYYQQTGSKQSANFYYQMVIDKWPGSVAAKMAKKEMSMGESVAAEKEGGVSSFLDLLGGKGKK